MSGAKTGLDRWNDYLLFWVWVSWSPRTCVCVWISRAPTVRQIETCDREHRSFTNAAFTTTMYHCYYKHYPIYHYHMHISHYNDVIMSTMASQITRLTIVYSTVYSRRISKKTSKLRVAGFVRGIHRWPVNSPHKGPVTRKMIPFDDVIMGIQGCSPDNRDQCLGT